jgi:phospholipase/carboxylesterase
MIRALLGLCLATLLAAPAPAATPSGKLETPAPTAPPSAPDKRNGVLTLAGGAHAYLPKGNDGSPLPLLVAFYGAGGNPHEVLASLRDDADRERFVLLIPTAKGANWDLIEDLLGRYGIEMNIRPRYGRDLKALDLALADLFVRVAIDPARIGMMGFSNGATYAVNVGLANPQLVRTIVGFSPGPVYFNQVDPSQRIFLSHGKADAVLSYSATRTIAARLRARKAAVHFESFDGAHGVPRDVRQKGIDFFAGRFDGDARKP